jgi:hypothetical protein
MTDQNTFDETLGAMRRLGSLLRSEDTVCEENALAALEAGRAVYWTSATYHNQAAVRFAQLANLGIPLGLAAIECTVHGVHAASPLELLASLIPLNAAARAALAAARKDCVDMMLVEAREEARAIAKREAA